MEMLFIFLQTAFISFFIAGLIWVVDAVLSIKKS